MLLEHFAHLIANRVDGVECCSRLLKHEPPTAMGAGRGEGNRNNMSESFSELFAKSETDIKEGEVAKGRVISVDEDNVTIDVGFKSEGLFPTWEFMEEDGTLLIKPGDIVGVLVEEAEDQNGLIVLSKEKADRLPSS